MTRVGRKSARISLFNPLSNCSIFGCSSVNPEFRARQGKESNTGVCTAADARERTVPRRCATIGLSGSLRERWQRCATKKILRYQE